MKKLILISLCFSISIWSHALTVVSTAGGLATAITNAGGSLSTLTKLTITGTIDARDFKTMRDNIPLLDTLDISGVTIGGYTGNLGTENMTGSYTSYTYNSNTIPQYAFCNINTMGGKTSLKYVSLPTTANTIGKTSFFNCANLSTVIFPPSILNINLSAFYSCVSLESANLNAAIIGENAFKDCPAMTSVTFTNNLMSIGKSAFAGCHGLTSLLIPSSVTSIESSAFYLCINLISVTNLANISSLSGSVFSSCRSLTTINIPSTVTTLSSGAFSGCISLSSIEIPSNVTVFGGMLFNETALTTITIPSLVNTIEYFAFQNCSTLTSIYVKRSTPPALGTEVFKNVDKTNCVLHVPVGSKSSYELSLQWKDFLNIVEDIPTEVNNVKRNPLKVSVQNEQAILSGISTGKNITIYNLQGTAIYNQPATTETVSVNLPAHGVYVVRVGEESVKVVY